MEMFILIIISIGGGLGNQMFQYAFYKSLKLYKNEVKIDIASSWNYAALCHNGYELNNIFKLNMDIATISDRNKLLGRFFPYFRIRLSSILGYNILFNNNIYRWKNEIEAISYMKEYYKLDNKYMMISAQSEKYFKLIENDIKKDFSFNIDFNEREIILKNNIENNQSVSIHVRRGDYIKLGWNNICNDNYYKNAIKYIKRRIEHPYFFVFSNDINWCKKFFKEKNIFFVDYNKGKESYKDMYFMSICKHNIIANSTFSWWGAYLNNNKEKIVIAPKQWFPNIKGTYDIIPDDWCRI